MAARRTCRYRLAAVFAAVPPGLLAAMLVIELAAG
jgi:hypothetical protein